jgi:uncharacterized 2Fe-2S/4Fe-4S cluster protein (DUF4445 family)
MSLELIFNQQRTAIEPGKSLFDYAEVLGINVPTSCRKQGKCKECVVEVVEGMNRLSTAAPEEKHLQGNFRLSCRAQVRSDSGLIRCHTMRRGEMRIERHAFDLPVARNKWKLNPTVTRKGDQIFIDDIQVATSEKAIHGLAMDLGTTTVVLKLFNLETGEVIADSSFENPQRFGGSDVMSRIHYDSLDGKRVLQRTLVGYLNHAIDELPVEGDAIFELVVAGNSTMRDIFFRLNVYPIGQAPYQSVTEIEMAECKRSTTSLSETAGRLGININPKARVYGLPIISGHVGADAAACMLAVNIAEEDRHIAIMDIGTNTELIIGNRHKILAASCPAGPAFEGGKISCGMPGLPGAVEHVRLKQNGSFDCTIIGNEPAEGICGSGLVDLLGTLLENEKMNSLGRLEDGSDRVVLDLPTIQKIYLTEGDINELAQAKGANVAGLRIVFEEYGMPFEDIDVFYLAGGFGRHLDVSFARRIGLIPNIPDSKIVQIGNASVEGAALALLSRDKRAELEKLVRTVRHCRLETHPGFFDVFVEGCQFKPVQSLAEQETTA